MNREQYPQQNTARMEKILGSSAQNGLSSKEASERLKKNGKNELGDAREPIVAAFFKTLIKNASLPIAVLGFGAAAFFIGKRVIFPLALYFAFLLLYFLFFLKRERGILEQKDRLLPRVRVIRDGKQVSISPELLVCGDLLLLSPGDILYTYAHVTTDAEMTVYGRRDGVGALFVKHGGDCFDGEKEPFNSLSPGDVVREGTGAAFVTDKAENVTLPEVASETLQNHGKVCRGATRLSFLIAILLLGVSVLRALLAKDYGLLGESVLIFTVLVSTAGCAFYPLLFDILFLYKNKRMREKNGALYASLSDAETLSDVDSFVLSTQSMFRSARYVAKYFETASGRRITEKMRGTGELSVLADALFSLKRKCEMTMAEEAVLAFSAKYATGHRMDLYAKSVSERCTLTSYRSPVDGRSFSLVWGDAETLIPNLLYFSEEGKTRILDARQRDVMLDGVRRLKKNGYRFLLFAETQTRNTPDGMPKTFADMKLLGFFALRKMTDSQAMRTLEALKEQKKKVFFIHDGENADWLTKEIRAFEGVPILDGARDSFREELSYFARDEEMCICIGTHLSSIQRAQVVTALESSGRRVAAFGNSFEDHRMMCAATAAIAPLHRDAGFVPPLVLETAAVHADGHVSSQVDSVKKAPSLLGGFGAFTAALCASLIGRCAVAFLGAVFGKIFLSASYYAVLGIVFDLLALCCFMLTEGRKQYNGSDGLLQENRKNFSFFAGFLAGALLVGGLAAYLAFRPLGFSFAAGSFVFVSLLLMLNVGMWRFSSARETTAALLYPFVSLLAVIGVFLLGHLTQGRLGFLFRPEIFFWALFPIALLMAVGKIIEAYFKHKNNFHIGDQNERM